MRRAKNSLYYDKQWCTGKVSEFSSENDGYVDMNTAGPCIQLKKNYDR